jgi:hypothetical protein
LQLAPGPGCSRVNPDLFIQREQRLHAHHTIVLQIMLALE